MSVEDILSGLQASSAKSKSRRDEVSSVLSSLQQAAQRRTARSAGGGGGRGGSGVRPGRAVGMSGSKTIGDIGKLHPNAPIVGIKDHQGHTVYVNRQVAPVFSAFLRDLKRTGYKVHSISGHAERNIAGTSTPSLHSYGFAIDINPGANPVTYGSRKTNLPRGVGRMARKYGLAWGGNWNGSKKDTMHFSVPFRGTK